MKTIITCEDDKPFIKIQEVENGVTMRDITTTLSQLWYSLQKHLFSNRSEKQIYSIQLPQNTLYYSAIDLEGNCYDLVIEVPKTRRSLLYGEGTAECFGEVGWPRMLMVVSKNHDTFSLLVFSIKDNENITPETTLYRFPFGHVNERGGICWGSVEKKNKTPDAIINAFITSKFSGHGIPIDVFQLVHSLDGNDFSDELLIPTRYQLKKLLKI